MSSDGHPSPTQLRARPGHPVVDAVGHRLEDGPVVGKPSGARLDAVFSSDIGRFDGELAEDGFISSDDFREFTFANAVRLWGTGNPGFFEGTAVAKAAGAVLEGRDA